jgi:hypothetical protein
MRVMWRPLAVAVAVAFVAGIGSAAAQTVTVKGAPAGTTLEFVLKGASVGSAPAGDDGTASVSASGATALGATEMDAYIFVDTCPDRRRVLVLERFTAPPALWEGCERKEVPGIYLVRAVTTFVVDVAGPLPILRLRQGPAPEQWLRSEDELTASIPKVRRPAPTGLILGGGAGLSSFSETPALACGNGPECSDNGMGLAFNAHGAFWINRILGVELGYLRPGGMTVTGRGPGYDFETTLDANIATATAKVGAPVGMARIYGFGGVNYHDAIRTTTETIEPTTVTTAEGISITYPGGTQVFQQETNGWGWMFGGGFEIWVSPMFGIYADAGYMAIKGGAVGGKDKAIDDNLTYFMVGARIKLGAKASASAK